MKHFIRMNFKVRHHHHQSQMSTTEHPLPHGTRPMTTRRAVLNSRHRCIEWVGAGGCRPWSTITTPCCRPILPNKQYKGYTSSLLENLELRDFSKFVERLRGFRGFQSVQGFTRSCRGFLEVVRSFQSFVGILGVVDFVGLLSLDIDYTKKFIIAFTILTLDHVPWLQGPSDINF